MNTLDVMWSLPTIESIGWTLVHFLWQGLLIAIALRVILQALGPNDARRRYAAATIAMLALILAPLVTYVSVEASSVPSALVFTRQILEPPGGDDLQALGGGPDITADAAERTYPEDGTRSVADWKTRITSYLHPLFPWMVLGWLSGVLFLSLRFGAGWLFTRQLKICGVRPVGEELQTRFDGLRKKLGVARPVQLLHSALVEVPTLVGYVKPVVLLPVSAITGLSSAQLEAILAHELAHVVRHDQLVNLLQTAAETVLFYHPAVWWVSDQIRAERENCCDDVAVATSGSLHVYVQALMQLEEQRQNPMRLVLAVSGGSLLSRVKRLVNTNGRGAAAPHCSWAGGLVAVPLVALLVLAAQTYAPPLPPAAAVADGRQPSAVVAGPAPGLSTMESEAAFDDVDHELDSFEAGTPGDEAVAALVMALEDADASMRAQIAQVLGERESPAAIEPLARLLQADESASVRSQAAWALGRIENRRGVPSLAKAVSTDESEQVVFQAIRALGMIEADAAVAALLPRLNDGHPEIRMQTAWALGSIESPRAVDALMRRYRSETEQTVNLAIIDALGRIEDARAVGLLSQAAKSGDPQLSRAAIAALGVIE